MHGQTETQIKFYSFPVTVFLLLTRCVDATHSFLFHFRSFSFHPLPLLCGDHRHIFIVVSSYHFDEQLVRGSSCVEG